MVSMERLAENNPAMIGLSPVPSLAAQPLVSPLTRAFLHLAAPKYWPLLLQLHMLKNNKARHNRPLKINDLSVLPSYRRAK